MCAETYVNVSRRDLFVFHKLQCWFLFKCFKLNLCWRSLYLSLLCDKDILRGMLRGKDEDNDGQVPHPSCLVFMVKEDGMEGELSTPQPPAGHWKLTPFSLSFSLHLFPPPCGCQTVLSSEGWTPDSRSGIALRLMNPSRPPPTGVAGWEACSDSIGIAYLP